MPSSPPSPLALTSRRRKSASKALVPGSFTNVRTVPPFSRTNQRLSSSGACSMPSGCSNDSAENTGSSAISSGAEPKPAGAVHVRFAGLESSPDEGAPPSGGDKDPPPEDEPPPQPDAIATAASAVLRRQSESVIRAF